MTDGWRNRITRFSAENPKRLKPNPANYRRHPIAQRTAYQAVLSEVGAVAPVIVNDRTGYLIDGHMRVEEAVANGVKKIDVAHVDLDETEEAMMLAMFDSVAAMAYDDVLSARELHAKIGDEGAVAAFLKRTAGWYSVPQESAAELDYGTEAVNDDGTRDSTMDRYETTNVRQIVVGFSEEEYAKQAPRIEAISNELNAKTQWDVLKALIEQTIPEAAPA